MLPSNVRIVPVAKRLSSLARNRMPAAISSGVPRRPRSWRAASASRVAPGSGLFLRMYVVEIRRVDGPGRDRVATDAVADVIDGNGPRQRRHRAFRGAIGGAIADADGGN